MDDPLFVTNAELSVEVNGKWVSLGKVGGLRIDDPEDLLRISTYETASQEEFRGRLAREFGV